MRRYIVSPAPYRAAGGERPKASTKRDTPRPMQYRRGRRVETIQTRAGDTTPPARANVDNIDTQTKAPPVWERPAYTIRPRKYGQRRQHRQRKRTSRPRVSIFARPRCPYPQQSRQAESLNNTPAVWKEQPRANDRQQRAGAGARVLPRRVCCIHTGQKPETNGRGAFSFGRVSDVFAKC